MRKSLPRARVRLTLRAGAGFVINVVGAFKIQLVPVKVHAQRELAVQKPRLDEREFIVLPLRAQLDEQAQFLAAAGEIRRMEQIKIALRQFPRKPTSASTELKPAPSVKLPVFFSSTFTIQVFAPGNRRVGRLRLHVHLVEILQTLRGVAC